MNEVYEHFKSFITPDYKNIFFQHKHNIQRSIINCNVLITNKLNMAINKNIHGGYSVIYEPLEVPKDLKDMNKNNLYTVNNLNYMIDDIILESSEGSLSVKKEHIKDDALPSTINRLLLLHKSYNSSYKYKFMSLDRLKIFKYNFKELIKLFIKSKFLYKDVPFNYFTPYTLKRHRFRKQKRQL